MSIKPDTPAMKKIDEIKHYLIRLHDEELIEDLHMQLKQAFLVHRNNQNKMINSMLYDVDNFFEGVQVDEIDASKVVKPKSKKKT